MKKLVRIKLINWHLFSNQTVEINNNCLLSGENGAGKSTFLDAIQYVLTGGKAKFNTAANTNARRDLEGYIRCKLGIENKTYLRNDDVTSHIAIEFYDDITNTSLIIGTVMEINKSGRTYERFYLINNQSIDDSLFIDDDNIIRGYSLFKKYLIFKEKEFTICDTKEQTRKLFLNALEIKNYKYIELIPKALAFRPIDELNKFVFDFLLNERRISIDDLRQNVRSYREFENLLKSLKEKEELLSNIESNYEIYKKYLIDKEIINILINLAQYEDLLYKQSNIIKDIDYIKLEIKDTQNNEILLDKKISNVNKEIESLTNVLNSNETYNFYKDIENKIKDKEIKFKQLTNDLSDLKEVIKNEKNLCKYIYNNIKNDDILRKYILNIDINNNIDIYEVKNLTKNVKDIYEDIKEEYTIKTNNLKSKKIDIERDLIEVDETIVKLVKNQFKFDYEVNRLKELIEEEIKKLTNKEIKVRVLCELIDVKDEEWRNALEGYLNTQRFDLIVEPTYFDVALRIYEKYKIKERLYGVGLVNTYELDKYEEISYNSLASKITSNNKFARNYVNMLLNNVVCCDSVDELKKYKTSITKTCMVYKNYTARQIREDIYKKPFIGIEAIKLQLDKYNKLKEDLENRKIECLKNISQYEFYLQRIKGHQLDYVNHKIKVYDEYNEVQNEIESLNNQINKFKINKEWVSLQEELDKKKNQIKDIENEKKQLILIEGKLSGDLEIKYSSLNSLNNEIKEAELFKNTIIKDKLFIEAKDEYKKLIESNKNDCLKVIKYCTDKLKQHDDVLNKSGINIVTMMNNYNNKYHVGFLASIENINDYFDELNKIRNYELIKYEEKAYESRINCEIIFKEQFIFKLRENIMIAHEELNNLNKALMNKKFGGDEYEFIYKANNNHNYGQYYKVIMSDEDYFTNTLFTESINDQNRIILKELFDKLVIDSTEEQAETTLEKFCDYRNYMSYDIKIHHHNGDTTLFSKVSREKSGGETQTPFYVVIAASFEQLITDKKKRFSPACFVMFDEAFNNMDESRIQAMMEFYKNLNIQLMIAVPPQRIETIIHHVNTTLIVTKDEDQSFIDSFSYEKNENKLIIY